MMDVKEKLGNETLHPDYLTGQCMEREAYTRYSSRYLDLPKYQIFMIFFSFQNFWGERWRIFEVKTYFLNISIAKLISYFIKCKQI